MITKTLFKNGMRCPRCLWESIYEPQNALNKSATDRGTKIGEEARKLFSPQILIPYGSKEEMSKKTADAIKSTKRTNILEASFTYGDCFCSVDIFRPVNKRKKICDIIEVKSMTQCDDSQRLDVSFQCHVLSGAGWTVRHAYVMNVDSTYKNKGKLSLKKMFKLTEIEPMNVDKGISYVRNMLSGMSKDNPPCTAISNSCKKGFDCPFWENCKKDFDCDVLHTSGLQFATKVKLIEAGRRSYEDLYAHVQNRTEPKLSKNAIIDIESHCINGSPIRDKSSIEAFLDSFKFPLYFLDFETFQADIPLWKGTTPYMQIPFQYSLHKMSQTGKISHMEFLADGVSDPRRAIAESLIKSCKKKGTILAYNASFEKARIRELASLFPDLKTNLLKLEERIDDLMIPFSKRWIWLAEQDGSYSIKHVLPALYPNNPDLDYSQLTGVHNGTEAADTYKKLGGLNEKERRESRVNLLSYCWLDTYALVLVYDYLRGIFVKNP